jgi:hypothetical protein
VSPNIPTEIFRGFPQSVCPVTTVIVTINRPPPLLPNSYLPTPFTITFPSNSTCKSSVVEAVSLILSRTCRLRQRDRPPLQWLLEAGPLICKQWETTRSVDSDLETPRKASNILASDGNNCGHMVTSGRITSNIKMSSGKQPLQCWSDKRKDRIRNVKSWKSWATTRAQHDVLRCRRKHLYPDNQDCDLWSVRH